MRDVGARAGGGPLRHPNPFIEHVVMIPAAMSEQHWGVGVAWQNGLHCPTTFPATGILAGASGWCGRPGECAECYPNSRSIEPGGEIRPRSAKKCRKAQCVKRLRPIPKAGQALLLRGVATSASRLCVVAVERGVPSPDSELRATRGFSIYCYHFAIILIQGGRN